MKTTKRTQVAIACDIVCGKRPNLGAVFNPPEWPEKPRLVGKITPVSRSKTYAKPAVDVEAL